MAMCSPRVFWAVARHGGCADVEQGLAVLVPDQDWKYLSTRTRQLSEKVCVCVCACVYAYVCVCICVCVCVCMDLSVSPLINLNDVILP